MQLKLLVRSRTASFGAHDDVVGMMSQESHVSMADDWNEIEMPSLFPWVDMSEDEESCDDSLCAVEEGGDKAEEEQGLSRNEFMQQMKEELQILDGLIRSRNFCTSYLDMKACVKGLQETNSIVRARMAEASNHNQGQEWVSANVARASSNKRQKGAQFGITKFT